MSNHFRKSIGGLYSYIFSLLSKTELRAGLSISGDRYHYVLMARPAKGKERIVQTRQGALQTMKIMPPCPVSISLETAITVFVRDALANKTPEQWMDDNEERVIPKGIKPDQILNDWYAENETITSATVLKTALTESLSPVRNASLLLEYAGAPLFDIGRLYGRCIDGPFIIWKLYDRQSVIGYVENAELRAVCSFWMGSADMRDAARESMDGFLLLCQSLSKQKSMPRVILLANEAVRTELKHAAAGVIDVIDPPVVEGLSIDFHEAYALALHEEPQLNFAPMDTIVEAAEFVRSRNRALKIIHFGFIGLMAVCIGLIGIKAAIGGLDQYTEKKMAPRRAAAQTYQTEKSRVEKLSQTAMSKSRFFAQKSMLTAPITELQTAFPEGVWAEEMSFSEADASSWTVSIIACAEASSLIPGLMSNLSTVSGMKNVRMLYSEQTDRSGKSGARVLRCKLEGTWKK